MDLSQRCQYTIFFLKEWEESPFFLNQNVTRIYIVITLLNEYIL